MWTIFKAFIEFVTILLLFYGLFFFGHKAYGIPASQPGIEPTPRALEGEVLTTRLPGKSLVIYLNIAVCTYQSQTPNLSIPISPTLPP